MKTNNVLKLIVAIVVSELAGVVGSLFTFPSITSWYAGIVKPSSIRRVGCLVRYGRPYIY